MNMDDPLAQELLGRAQAEANVPAPPPSTGDSVVDRVLALLPAMDNKVTVMPRTGLHPAVQKTLSPGAAAFHTPGSPALTVLSDSAMYKAATNDRDRLAQYLLASAILHEKTHDQYPKGGEVEPYTAQLKFLETFKPNAGSAKEFNSYRQSVEQLQQILKELKRGKQPHAWQ